MDRDVIFQVVPPSALREAVAYLNFSPIINAKQPYLHYRYASEEQQSAWLNQNRERLEDEFSRVGSWSFGDDRSYTEIVKGLSSHLNVFSSASETEEIEKEIIAKVWKNAVAKMTPSQLKELKSKAEALALEHGTSIGKELGGLATLTAAQMSGFGVYLLGSTILGAVNGALGLGLSFGAFTGLSSLISTVIGPVGWGVLGLATIVKLGKPNYEKILPVVILFATHRASIDPMELNIAEIKIKLPAVWEKYCANNPETASQFAKYYAKKKVEKKAAAKAGGA